MTRIKRIRTELIYEKPMIFLIWPYMPYSSTELVEVWFNVLLHNLFCSLYFLCAYVVKLFSSFSLCLCGEQLKNYDLFCSL
jgi:hypothetical protein